MRAMIEAQKDYEIELQFKENEISERERISSLIGTSFEELIIDESTFAIPQPDISSLKKRVLFADKPHFSICIHISVVSSSAFPNTIKSNVTY